MLVPLFVGVTLALAVGVYAIWIGFDRDRAFYPTVLIVVALYYVLFAAMGGGPRTAFVESSIAAVFLLAASLGFRRNLWLVAAGLAAHGILDTFHGAVVSDPGVPSWWPVFCASYDLTAAAFFAMTLLRHPARTKPRDANVQ